MKQLLERNRIIQVRCNPCCNGIMKQYVLVYNVVYEMVIVKTASKK